jgi:transposase InsO family protein
MGLREKLDIFKHLKALVPQVEAQTSKHMKLLHTDGGSEYTENTVKRFLEDRGIGHEITTPDMPQHNSVAERMNRTRLDKVRALLTDAGLPESYWYNTLSYTVYLHNISPTHALDNTTPNEAWSGNKLDISWLHVFGS